MKGIEEVLPTQTKKITMQSNQNHTTMNAQVKTTVSTKTLGEVQQISNTIYSYYRDIARPLSEARLILDVLDSYLKERFKRHVGFRYFLEVVYKTELIRAYDVKVDKILHGEDEKPNVSRNLELLPIETLAIVKSIFKTIEDLADRISYETSEMAERTERVNIDDSLLEFFREASKYAEQLSSYLGRVIVVNSEDEAAVNAFTGTKEFQNLLTKTTEEVEQGLEYLKQAHEEYLAWFLNSIEDEEYEDGEDTDEYDEYDEYEDDEYEDEEYEEE